jgi:Rod binding domain-containing protein
MDQIDIAALNTYQAGVGQTALRLNYLKSSGAGDDPENLRAASRELEAYFIHVLMREMRKTVPANSIMSGGKAEEIFQDFLDEELSGQMAASGRLGLADMIFDNLQNILKIKAENADKYI